MPFGCFLTPDTSILNLISKGCAMNDLLRPYANALSFARQRTLDLFGKITASSNALEALGWRPGPGRAHLAWQFMHIAITDDRYLHLRILNQEPKWPDLGKRFGGGSTPDDNIPSAAEIRRSLDEARSRLLAFIETIDPAKLDQKPFSEAQRTYRESLELLAWHEAHHQGQAHITFNLYQAAHGKK